ncbi:hypothetical protein CDD82_4112 [Ophiocordyceps australis]|uniref:Flavoprotein domain-containing protein n=1 Tax=Ophiocordyceps australis TaxID=1399860 RepID=A0A2C5Z8Z7_9HYPO|nr:hypothetical protein CDD82_4112 [Ophiocordyceps australis]
MLHAMRKGSVDAQADNSAAGIVHLACKDKKCHLLLAATGSVATMKLESVINGLATHNNLSIRVILTSAAEHFLGGQAPHDGQPSVADIRRLPNVDGIYTDAAEWTRPWIRGAPILHIELRRWADLMIICPLSANSMAKMVAGICDNLVLSVVRAWDADGSLDFAQGAAANRKLKGKRKIVVALAMNTAMWSHPITASHIRVLEEDWGGRDGWIEVLRPIPKMLACGDSGNGAMVEWEEIVAVAEAKLGLGQTPIGTP